MKVKIVKLHKHAVLPSYAHDLDAGLDLTAVTKDVVDNGDYGYQEFGCGIAIQIPEDYVGLIFPRSSISRTGEILANSVACIDPGFSGEIKLRFKYIKGSKQYEIGDRVGQLIIIPRPKIEFEVVDKLDDSERKADGFGSTN